MNRLKVQGRGGKSKSPKRKKKTEKSPKTTKEKVKKEISEEDRVNKNEKWEKEDLLKKAFNTIERDGFVSKDECIDASKKHKDKFLQNIIKITKSELLIRNSRQ